VPATRAKGAGDRWKSIGDTLKSSGYRRQKHRRQAPYPGSRAGSGLCDYIRMKQDKSVRKKSALANLPVDLSAPLPNEDPLLEPNDQFLSGAQAAALLSTHPRTLERWERTDPPLLPCFRLPNGLRRYRRSDVLKLLSPTRWEPRSRLQARAAMMRERRAEMRPPKAGQSEPVRS
jgi:hypothetical protein